MVLPEYAPLVLSSWTVAAYLAELWDRFPHIAITSPEKRCGKSLLLELLSLIVSKPRYTTNISPGALYWLVEKERPTLLMDESQSLVRRGSEASEVIREILNAGIGRNATVIRRGGERFEGVQEYHVYSPKVFALIGTLDSVLADRSLPIALERKTAGDEVERYRSRVVAPLGQAVREKIERWAKDNEKRVADVYDRLEPFDIGNDRMAELLLPLQAVLTVACPCVLDSLAEYATALDERDRQEEMQSPGVRILAACREVFDGVSFQPTDTLLNLLLDRREEPWHRWNHGSPMTREALANLLRPYNIRPSRNKAQTARGYHRADFIAAWDRYLPPTPKNPG